MLHRPPDKRFGVAPQVGTHVAVDAVHDWLHHRAQRAPSAGEDRVVQGVLGVKVNVERRRADAHPARDLAQRQSRDALLGHDLQGDVEHLGDGLLAPPLPAVGSLHRPGTHSHRVSYDYEEVNSPFGWLPCRWSAIVVSTPRNEARPRSRPARRLAPAAWRSAGWAAARLVSKIRRPPTATLYPSTLFL